MSVNALSGYQAHEVAKAFYEGSADNSELAGGYQIGGNYAYIYSEDENEWPKQISLADFVGGVAFELAVEGKVPVEHTIPTTIARVCLSLGMMVGSQGNPKTTSLVLNGKLS